MVLYLIKVEQKMRGYMQVWTMRWDVLLESCSEGSTMECLYLFVPLALLAIVRFTISPFYHFEFIIFIVPHSLKVLNFCIDVVLPWLYVYWCSSYGLLVYVFVRSLRFLFQGLQIEDLGVQMYSCISQVSWAIICYD